MQGRGRKDRREKGDMVAEKIISVVSGKGGVGKTVTALNLGFALSKMQQDVTVVDADITASNLALHLGITWFPITLQDVLSGSAKIEIAIYDAHGLRIVPSSLSLNYLNAKTDRLKNVLRSLSGTVIIDSPPGFGRDVLNILEASTDVIVITTPEIASITNAVKMLKFAKRNVLGLIVNRHQGFLKRQHIEEVCEAPVIGVVPEDKNMARSAFEKKPLLHYKPHSKASREYMRIASLLTGIEYRPSFWKRILMVRT